MTYSTQVRNSRSTVHISHVNGSQILDLCRSVMLCERISNLREQEFLTPLVNLIGANVKPITIDDAIKFGNIILLVLPCRKRQELFTGKIVIDATNPYSERFAVLGRGNDTSTETIAKT